MVGLPESNKVTNKMVITDILLKSIKLEVMDNVDIEPRAKVYLICHW